MKERILQEDNRENNIMKKERKEWDSEIRNKKLYVIHMAKRHITVNCQNSKYERFCKNIEHSSKIECFFLFPFGIDTECWFTVMWQHVTIDKSKFIS